MLSIACDALIMVARTGQSARSFVLFLVFVGVLTAGVPVAFGQGVGLRGGLSVDPEQVYVGSHVETRELVPGLHFRPGIDGSFGGGFKVASLNIDFIYKYPVGQVWKIYQGGGPVLHILRAGEPAELDVTGGLAGVFGFMHASGFFVEFRAGGGSVAAFKFGVGLTID